MGCSAQHVSGLYILGKNQEDGQSCVGRALCSPAAPSARGIEGTGGNTAHSLKLVQVVDISSASSGPPSSSFETAVCESDLWVFFLHLLGLAPLSSVSDKYL